MGTLGRGIYLRYQTYWLSVQKSGRRQFISLQTHDPAEAVQRAEQARRSPELLPRTGLLADIDRFIAAKKAQRKFTSLETERWARRALIKMSRAYPDRTTASLTAHEMEDFSRLLHRSQAETGAMSYLRAIRSFFAWSIVEKIRYDNPCRGLIHEPAEPARERHATKEQRDALIETCERQRACTKGMDPIHGPDPARGTYHEPLHFALYCALHAGMRFKEIVEARPDWFHLEGAEPYVMIQKTPTFVPKNKRRRHVPLTQPFVRFLRSYGLRGPFMLMPEKQQGKHQYRYDFRAPWDAHAGEHAVPWLTPHLARHTFGSLLVQSDVAIFKVAKWMGHGVGVCEKHYSHLRPGDSGIDRML